MMVVNNENSSPQTRFHLFLGKPRHPVVLKREYGKDLIFFGAIDYNEILSRGSETRVREETRRLIDILGYDGKYIVAPSHDLMMAEAPAINIWAMYDKAQKYSAKRV